MTPLKIAIVSYLAPLHGQTIAVALDSESKLPTACQWAIFAFVDPSLKPSVDYCRANGIKTCAYWLGSDSYRALHDRRYRASLPKFDLHIACHDRLADELKQWGIEAQVVYLLARNVPRHYYEPAEPKVGVYMPTAKGKYWFEKIIELAAAVPELPFVFYGCDELPTLPDNCVNAGRFNPEFASKLLRAFSVLLRYTAHDGFPQNVIEMKMQGKHCITNYPYQGCMHADDEKAVIDLLRGTDVHRRDSSPWVEWYLSNCTPEVFAQNIRRILK